MNLKKIGVLTLICTIIFMIGLFTRDQKNTLPLIAIANYGPHSSLKESIQGIKDELTQSGLIENQHIKYEIVDVGFDQSLIPQMIMSLKSHHPKVLVVTTTPVAQYAKGIITDIPLVYNVITDPVAAGLIDEINQSHHNITGSSDKQNLNLLFDYAKRLLPHASTVGVLYSTAEANDIALLAMLKKSAKKSLMNLIAVPVDQARDIPLAMQQFKHKVDFIYVGASGAIQPALPVIAAESKKMKIPVFNLNEEAVHAHLVFASFGVDYHQVGMNTGKLIFKILQGTPVKTLQPLYPMAKDHHGFLSNKNASQLGLVLPENNISRLEEKNNVTTH